MTSLITDAFQYYQVTWVGLKRIYLCFCLYTLLPIRPKAIYSIIIMMSSEMGGKKITAVHKHTVGKTINNTQTSDVRTVNPQGS